VPSDSELVPFGCQHSITAHSLVRLLPDAKQQLDTADCSSSPSGIMVDLWLDVCTCPHEVLVGWEGPEQEQRINEQHSSQGVGVVHLLARLDGCHVPVSILETKWAAAGSSTDTYPKQKMVRPVAKVLASASEDEL